VAGFCFPWTIIPKCEGCSEAGCPDYVAAVRRAALVLANSHTTLERAEKVLGRLPQAKVCWLGTESDELVQSRETGPPAVMFLGRSDDLFAKGQDILIEVWPKVVSAVPDATLVFVGGGGSLDRLRRLAGASAAAARIRILGFQSQMEVDQQFSRATVFVLLSYVEGFGLVLIEAMRHGVPVLASTEDASCEINVDGQTGFNVSRHDTKGIVDRLVLMLRDDGLSRRMGDAGRLRWRNHFRYSAFQARFTKTIGPWLEA
jgi:phosphatidylinositol alpha-1,6-mannosyltransferase